MSCIFHFSAHTWVRLADLAVGARLPVEPVQGFASVGDPPAHDLRTSDPRAPGARPVLLLRSPAARAPRAFPTACLLFLCISTTGCAVLGLRPHYTEASAAVEEERVVIDSEPHGAAVVRDGVIVGTTPADVTFTYPAVKAVGRLKYCWLVPLLGVGDLTAAGASMWFSYTHVYKSELRDLGVAGMIASGAWGAIGLVGILAPALSRCRAGEKMASYTPHTYLLKVTKDGFEEPTIVRVPHSSGERNVTAVLRGLERRDWDVAREQNTCSAYQRYLTTYSRGRWRDAALDHIEDCDWQRADDRHSPEGYREYLGKYSAGKYSQQAKDNIEEIAWQRIKERPRSVSR